MYLRRSVCPESPVPLRTWTYQLAGRPFSSDWAFETLEPYLLSWSGPTSPADALPPYPDARESGCRTVRGWLGGEIREVTCRDAEGGFEVDVSGIGRFAVSWTVGHVSCISLEPGLTRELIEEVVLGPPISLSLASREIWCLHASAVVHASKAILFLGTSGCGKSTLAGHCGNRVGFSRIADDILPCSASEGEPLAHPHFPQLKRPVAEQYPLNAGRNIPIGALVVLDPGENRCTPEVQLLPMMEGVKRLAEQTVGVGMFNRSLHERHLQFVARLLESVPIFVLHFPHDYDRLPDVCDRLVRETMKHSP